MDIQNLKKDDLLNYFRGESDNYLEEIIEDTKDYKKRAKKINDSIQKLRDNLIERVLEKDFTRDEQLDKILLINYVTNVVMLEYRNKVWGYDYMAFSRRIGEIWEPFCKLPFYYPVKELELYTPPNFEDVKNDLKVEITEYVNKLSISNEEKEDLFNYFNSVWTLVESGGIKLELDLHFIQDNIYYDVDYKSGFSSNEKGNTNRLLLVASIYASLPNKHKNLIFVRQAEEDNNHYLQTLKNSPYWEVYCADNAYAKIEEFTGFDLRDWMDEHMDWKNDISTDFKIYLEENDLLKYLTW